MQNKKDGIVEIKGKEYKTVAQRVIEVNADYRADNKLEIKTEIVRLDDKMVVMKAVAVIDGKEFHGHAYELFNASKLNAVSGIENCETSCVGSCLGMAGYGTIESLDSADAVQRSIEQQGQLNDDQFPQRQTQAKPESEESYSTKKLGDYDENYIPIQTGKNAGKAIKDLDDNTLIWIRDTSRMDDELKLFIHNYLQNKQA